MDFLESPYFPNEKAQHHRKPPTDSDLLGLLNGSPSLFAPVRLEVDGATFANMDARFDGILHAHWKDNRAKYAYEYKASSTPQAIRHAIDQFLARKLPDGLLPLIIVPYLTSEQLAALDENNVSGIDLCGNGLLLSPEYRVWRSGYPNLYKDSRPIRNPFAGDSSVFARCFLLQQEFASLSDLRKFALQKASVVDTGDVNNPKVDAFEALVGAYSLGTASKVVKKLQDELIVSRGERGIVLQDVVRLLFLLRRGWRQVGRAGVIGKTALSSEEIWARLDEQRGAEGFRFVATGMASTGYHKVLSGIAKLSLYVDNLSAATVRLEVRPGRAFANIELIEDRKNVVYFDARRGGLAIWSSPIQTWLELTAAGPREREAASQLESLWLGTRGDDLK